MKKNFANNLVKTVFAAAAATMLVACGNSGAGIEVIDDPEPITVSDDEPDTMNPEADIDVEPEGEPDDFSDELPDDMLEAQPTCGRFDENYTITEDEAYDFMTVYMSAFSSSLCAAFTDNGVEDIIVDQGCIENIGSVYGIGTAVSELGEGEPYFFDGVADDTSMSMVENDIIAPEEMDLITADGIFGYGVYCVNAYAAQKVFDEFYGEGVVDAFSFDNYEEAFSSQSGYIITGTGIGDGGEYAYDTKEIELNGNVATLICDEYFTYPASDESEIDGECEITLYKDATGVHFYSKKLLMAE